MRAFLLSAVLILCTGCATIMTGGTNQYVTIQSQPPGAKVVIDGQQDYGGVTPLRIQVSRRMGHFIHVSLAGYDAQDIQLGQAFNLWFIGDVIALPPIGFIVDLADGSFLSVNPSELDVTMKR